MNQEQQIPEAVEGLDSSESTGWGDYPLDSVFVRKDQRTVTEIVGRIDKGRYILDPEFQRDFVWPLSKQSRLIESCLMRIPLPVFYFAEAKDGRVIVVDGLQRLITFYRYINNKFALTGLGDGTETNAQKGFLTNKRFKDLPLVLQERIEDTQLVLYILDAKAPERAKLDIFERVNGGVPLTRQQMRNCLFNGPATIWLKKMADNELFFSVTGGSLDKKTMRDREAINRFCAFLLLGPRQYKGDMDDFLAKTLDQVNGFNEHELSDMSEQFLRSMHSNKILFGEHAFRKSSRDYGQYVARTVINISLFDVCSVGMAGISNEIVEGNKDEFRGAIKELLSDDDFVSVITYSTNGTKEVRRRFQMMNDALTRVIRYAKSTDH